MKLTKNQKNCKYCHGKEDIINTLHYGGVGCILGQVVHIEGDRLVVEEGTIESKKINYCPMCGRSLNGEEE